MIGISGRFLCPNASFGRTRNVASVCLTVCVLCCHSKRNVIPDQVGQFRHGIQQYPPLSQLPYDTQNHCKSLACELMSSTQTDLSFRSPFVILKC